MSNTLLYRMVDHLDAPRRYFALTIDEVVVVGAGMLLMVGSSKKVMVMILCALLLFTLKTIKQGKGPRYLWVISYWYLPQFATRWMLSRLPASHLRVWRI